MILGLDYGDKRIGVAISGFELTALPLKTIIKKDEFTIKPAVAEIKKIIIERNICKIVLGYPINMNGTKSSQTLKIEDFKERLHRNFKTLDIVLHDETLTSFEAEEILLSKYKYIKKEDVDMVAATLMLQDYLNSKSKENDGK